VDFSDLKPLDGVWALNDLPIHTWQEGETYTLVKLQNSPYYVSLMSMDSNVFYDYHTKFRQSIGYENEISWESFLELFNKVKEEGYFNKSKNPILVTEKIGQVNGHHRLAILAVLHGLHAKVFISNGTVYFPALDGLLSERDGLLSERDGLLSERDGLLSERDGLLSERDGLLSERDGLFTSKSWRVTQPFRYLRSFLVKLIS
jgi:hypothetical protein